MTLDELLHEYDTCHHKYESCKQSTERLIQTILDKAGVRVHKVECRVKLKDSLKRKIEAKSDKYTHLSAITDIVAFRIITFFEDEVDMVAEIIKTEFDIDEENSTDKRLKNSDKFGYQSLHYVFTYNKERINLPEYNAFDKLKCEIQIRSILQHAWAEIEHDIGYKSEIGIPAPVKRNFLRTAALLETADLEFIRLRDTLTQYEKEIKNKIEHTPNEVLIDKVSIKTFIEQNEVVKEIDQIIAAEYNGIISSQLTDRDIQDAIFELNYVGLKNIQELNESLTINKKALILFSQKMLDGVLLHKKARSTPIAINQGRTIFYLVYFLLGKAGDINKILSYFYDHNIYTYESDEATVEKIINIYQEVSKADK